MPPPAEVSPDATVSGGNILSMLAAMGPFRRRGEAALEEVGLSGVTAEGWYPLAPYVRALATIGERMGPNTLFQVGRQIPNHVPLPPGIDTFEKVLGSFGVAFEMNHRGVPPGRIRHQATTGRSGIIETSTPYPSDFDRGVTQGFFQKFLNARVNVTHDQCPACKNSGGDTCRFVVAMPVG